MPGFQNPRHQKKERAGTFEELCHNYVHERMQCLSYRNTFSIPLERFREVRLIENVQEVIMLTHKT